MRVGLIASVIGHLIVIASAFASFVSAEKLSTSEAISVELVQAEAPAAIVAPKDPASRPAKLKPPKSEATVVPPPSPTLPSATSATKISALASAGLASSSRPTTMTKEELDALSAQARRCWNVPTGWTDPRKVSVIIRFRLNRDGTLNGKPAVVEFPASQIGKASADNAVRAVAQCAPYHLPPEKYDQWTDVQLRFTPS
jgi:hypothetical protein